jgi:large subunit ribosomal protein L32e
MAPLPPEAIAAGVGAVAIGAAAAYSYFTGESTSAEIDLDDDGTNEAEVEFGGDDENDEVAKGEPVEAQNPTPDAVLEKSGLTDVKGIQATRAENLRGAGYSTPTDLYYASDENLAEVKQIGPYTVEQIRDDIGGIDSRGKGEGNESTGESDAEVDTNSQDASETDTESEQ